MKDIRLCKVWLRWEDGKEKNVVIWLDIDESIEDQIFKSFNPVEPTAPQLSDFKWREAQGEQQ